MNKSSNTENKIKNRSEAFINAIVAMFRAILKSELAKISGFVIILIIALMLIMPFLLSSRALKSNLQNKIATISGGNFKIKGDVDIAIFPLPAITINNSSLTNYQYFNQNCNFHFDKIIIRFPLIASNNNIFSLIKLNKPVAECFFPDQKPEKLILGDQEREGQDDDKNKNQQKIDNNEIAMSIFPIDKIDNIKFNHYNFNLAVNDGKIINHSNSLVTKNINNINFFTKLRNNKFGGDVEFNIDRNKYNGEFRIVFNGHAGDNKSFINIISNDINLNITGDVANDRSKFLMPEFSGKITANIFNIKDLYGAIFYSDAIYEKLKNSDKKLLINANIKSGNNEILIDNINFDSELISGSGDVNFDFNYKIPLIDINFNLENLDLSNIWSLDKAKILLKDNSGNKNILQPVDAGDKSNDIKNDLDIKNNDQITKDEKENSDNNLQKSSDESVSSKNINSNKNITKSGNVSTNIDSNQNNKDLEGDEGDENNNNNSANNDRQLVIEMPLNPANDLNVKSNDNKVVDNNQNLQKYDVKNSPNLLQDDSNSLNKKDDKQKDFVISGVKNNKQKYSDNILDMKEFFNKIADEKSQKKKYFDLTAEINIKNINYFDAELKNFSLYFTISKNGEIAILPMNFQLKNVGMFRFIGFFDNSGISPILVGNIDSFGDNFENFVKIFKFNDKIIKKDLLKNYQINSRILMVPNQIILDDFYLSLNSGDAQIIGNVKIDDRYDNTKIYATLEAANFNYDRYFNKFDFDQYKEPGGLFRRLIWLNEMMSIYDIDLKFDNLIYNNKAYTDSKIGFLFGYGNVGLKYFDLRNLDNRYLGNFKIDVGGKKPMINIDFMANGLKYFSKNWQKISENKDKKPVNILEDKSIKNYNNHPNIFEEFLQLPSLDGFDGKINIDINNSSFDNIDVSSLKIKSNIKDGVAEIKDLKSTIFGGYVNYKGSIGLKFNKNISGNIEAKSINLKNVFDIFKVNNIAGTANIASSISFLASDYKQFIDSLNANVKFNINAPIIEKFGITQLVQKMFFHKIYQKELENPESILFNPANQSYFKNSNGQFIVNKGDLKYKVNATAPALTAIVSGKINLDSGKNTATSNIIFLTGNPTKPTAINLAISFMDSKNGFEQKTNFNQVYQYLGIGKKDNISQNIANPTIGNSQLIDKVN